MAPDNAEPVSSTAPKTAAVVWQQSTETVQAYDGLSQDVMVWSGSMGDYELTVAFNATFGTYLWFVIGASSGQDVADGEAPTLDEAKAAAEAAMPTEVQGQEQMDFAASRKTATAAEWTQEMVWANTYPGLREQVVYHSAIVGDFELSAFRVVDHYVWAVTGLGSEAEIADGKAHTLDEAKRAAEAAVPTQVDGQMSMFSSLMTADAWPLRCMACGMPGEVAWSRIQAAVDSGRPINCPRCGSIDLDVDDPHQRTASAGCRTEIIPLGGGSSYVVCHTCGAMSDTFHSTDGGSSVSQRAWAWSAEHEGRTTASRHTAKRFSVQQLMTPDAGWKWYVIDAETLNEDGEPEDIAGPYGSESMARFDAERWEQDPDLSPGSGWKNDWSDLVKQLDDPELWERMRWASRTATQWPEGDAFMTTGRPSTDEIEADLASTDRLIPLGPRPDADPKSIEARRQLVRAAKIDEVTRTVQADNPRLPRAEARRLARLAVDTYIMPRAVSRSERGR